MDNKTIVSIQVVSAEQALLWLTADSYKHQRILKSDHVAFLAEEMRQQSFKQDTPIEFCLTDGKEELTDGQHRLAAIVACGIPQRFVIIRRSMLDEEAVALDYTRTDKGRPRTIAEDYKVLGLEEEMNLTSTQLEKLGAAVQFINGDFGTSRTRYKMHSKPRLRLMRDYANAAHLFFTETRGASRPLDHRLVRRATMSVGIVTYKYSVETFGEAVDDFWNGIALDDGIRATDPRKLAIKHLAEKGMPGGGGNSSAVTPAYSARFIAKCFNLFVTGEEAKMVKVMDSSQPIIILGSPFDGKDK